ncbi:unnamed protein product [Lactuca virosa]|uniref:SWIM-type domain-containing protein n=1 Tax=Lactuca virosa TaxID=75947 RepID=A0AAU9LV18_9ASTR|nr:unnamed protein product [Lactuca virosa]
MEGVLDFDTIDVELDEDLLKKQSRRCRDEFLNSLSIDDEDEDFIIPLFENIEDDEAPVEEEPLDDEQEEEENVDEVVDEEENDSEAQFKYSTHDPNVKWNRMKPQEGERELAEKWEGDVCPSAIKKMEEFGEDLKFWRVHPSGQNEFEVRNGLESYGVNIEKRSCACRLWDVSGIPCVHAQASIMLTHQDPKTFISRLPMLKVDWKEVDRVMKKKKDMDKEMEWKEVEMDKVMKKKKDMGKEMEWKEVEMDKKEKEMEKKKMEKEMENETKEMEKGMKWKELKLKMFKEMIKVEKELKWKLKMFKEMKKVFQ